MSTPKIGIPYHNTCSWYFRSNFNGPEHWDTLIDGLANIVHIHLPFFTPEDYWFEISNDQVANVFASAKPALELSLNRLDDLFCISLSVVDWYDASHHECAEDLIDTLDEIFSEIFEDLSRNPF
jgi:hypothetical protein